MLPACVTKTAISLRNGVSKKAPEIAIGVGLFCFGCAVVSGVKETPKAIRLVNAKKEELGYEEEEKLPVTELFKAVWKCYIPMAISFTAGATCILGAHKIQCQRNAALAAAYQICEKSFRDYKEKVVEVIGEKKEKEVKDKVAEKRVKEDPPIPAQIVMSGRGNTLCYDSITGRYFKSDMQSIRKLINDLNYRMESEHYISLNEFFYDLGLPIVDLGDLLGWNIEKGLIDIDFSSILDPDGNPCLVLNYNPMPRYEYRC